MSDSVYILTIAATVETEMATITTKRVKTVIVFFAMRLMKCVSVQGALAD